MKTHDQAQVALQVLQQVEHLRLHRHVQRRDRLVGHDEVRLHGQRPGDADALALAARELVRVARAVVGVQARALEQLADRGPRGGPRAAVECPAPRPGSRPPSCAG